MSAQSINCLPQQIQSRRQSAGRFPIMMDCYSDRKCHENGFTHLGCEANASTRRERRALPLQAVAASADANQLQGTNLKDQEARMQELYDRETPLVDRMLEKIDKLGFVDRAVAELTGEPTELEEKREAISEVIEDCFEEITEGTLMVITGFAQAAYGQKHNGLAETLEMLREEILKHVSHQLPPEMQILDMISSLLDKPREERTERLKQIHEEGFEQIPQTELSSVRTTASQMLEDIEEKLEIIDRSLVAKLCFVREDVDQAANELGLVFPGSEYMEFMETTWRLLPEGNAAFVSNLMQTGNPDKRRALLEQCILDDFNDPKDKLAKLWRSQGVRPGRFLNTVSALQNGLKLKQGQQSDGRDIERLKDIKDTTLSILQKLLVPAPM